LTRSRRKSSQKRRRWLIFLPLAAMIQATVSIVAKTATAIKATDSIATNDYMRIAIEKINAMITLVVKRRTSRKSSTRRRMIASAITSRRKVARPCTMTTLLY
jgi:hypothetical protein